MIREICNIIKKENEKRRETRKQRKKKLHRALDIRENYEDTNILKFVGEVKTFVP